MSDFAAAFFSGFALGALTLWQWFRSQGLIRSPVEWYGRGLCRCCELAAEPWPPSSCSCPCHELAKGSTNESHR